MKLPHDPFPLIFAEGDPPTKLWCLELFGLRQSAAAKDWLASLLKRQSVDGSFESALQAKHWGMRETVRNAIMLLRLGTPADEVQVASAVQFVLQHQNADGGWAENPVLAIPPFMRGFLSNERSVTWLTADVITLLQLAGQATGRAYQCAVAWLRDAQMPNGGWPSISPQEPVPQGRADPDATAQITFLMCDLFGEHDAAYQAGLSVFEAELDQVAVDVERGYHVSRADGCRQELEVCGLTHLLLSWLGDQPTRIERGHNATDPRVAKMMTALVHRQRDDGGWRPFWATESSPLYTLLAVKVLVLTGATLRTELPDMARYALQSRLVDG